MTDDYAKDSLKPVALVELADGGAEKAEKAEKPAATSACAMAAFVPQIESDEDTDCEFIFVVDRSGTALLTSSLLDTP